MNIKKIWRTHKDKLLTAFIYLCCFMTVFFAVETKKDYNLDEIFTYGLSNHQYVDTTEMRVIEGQKYEPAGNAWYDYMVVQPQGRFDYANVWKNQTEDVHPILYYVLVHTISSFFPLRFGRWFAGIVNAVFFALTLYVARKIVYSFFQDKRSVFVFSLHFILCGGMIVAVRFFRMYIMAMFFVTWITWLFICLYKSLHNGTASRGLYVKIGFAAMLGGLTHYYFLVYLVLLCVVYGLLILSEKRLGDFGRLVGCMAAAAVGTIAVFPAMLRHFFVSDRGKQSIQGFMDNTVSNYAEDLSDYMGFLNEYLFGGIIWLLILILLVVVAVKKIHFRISRPLLGEILLLVIPAAFYFLMISRIAVYNTDRYIYPIYGVALIAGTGIVYYLSHAVMKRKMADAFVIVITLCMVIGSWFCTKLIYNEPGEDAIPYEELDALYLYKDSDLWRVQAGFGNFSRCKSIRFFSDDGFDYIYQNDTMEEEELLVIIQDEIEDAQPYLSGIVAVCPNLEHYEEIGHSGYATMYYLN